MDKVVVWFNRTFSHVRGALELIRTGDSKGEFTTLCTHPNPYFSGFLAADETAVEPSHIDEDAYVEYCLQMCRRRGVALFFPGHHAHALIPHRETFAALGTQLCTVASLQAKAALDDKGRFYAAHATDRIPGPEVIRVADYPQYAQAYRSLRARHAVVSIKPATGVYGIGFRVIDEHRRALDHLLHGIDYHVAAQDLERELREVGVFPELLVMEYLPGHEYSVDCLAQEGTLMVALARRKEKGSGNGQTIVQIVEIEETCGRIAALYRLDGIFNVQFREDAQGELRLLEVNARMSGGIAMACLAGPNLPYLSVVARRRRLLATDIPPVRLGLRVGEYHQATLLPSPP